MILNLRGVIMRPSALANMEDFLIEDSGISSGIGGKSLIRRSRAGSTGLGFGSRDADMELSEMHHWKREGPSMERESNDLSMRSSPKSLSGGVQVHISASVRWEDGLEAEEWAAGKQYPGGFAK
jgi:hypothetical protein